MADDRRDVWDLFTLAFWFVFFAVGLVPELFFSAVRDAAAVVSYNALVNSSAVITVSFSAYIAFFAFRRCRAADLSRYLSQGKALEVALIALANYLSKAHGLGFSGARLDASDGEFETLPAWEVVAAECGGRPNIEKIAADMDAFVTGLRAELRELRDGI